MALDIEPGQTIEFDYIVPDVGAIRGQQIAASLARNLPEANERRGLTVVASGPSAKGFHVESSALWHHTPEAALAPTLALNGALHQFVAKGCAPDFYAACDPQELVADFLTEAPKSTIYYVASKCHSAVFDRLQGRDVRLWHVKDHEMPGRLRTPLCSSITMCALWLMMRQGFTDFDVWGWDACFMGGEHHLGEQAPEYAQQPNFTRINIGGRIEGDEVIGGQTFDTTHTWAAEARGAEQLFQLAEYMDVRININGDGMIKAVRQSILGD